MLRSASSLSRPPRSRPRRGSPATCERAASSCRSSSTPKAAAAIQDSGLAGYVDINDNATARAAMSGLMLAGAVERAVGIETIPHLTPRDSTIMGLGRSSCAPTQRASATSSPVTGDPPEIARAQGGSTSSTRSGSHV